MRRTKGRVYGPYREGKKWRVILSEHGTRSSETFEREDTAQEFADDARAAFAIEEVTVADGMVGYEQHLRETVTDHGRMTAVKGIVRMIPDDRIEIAAVDKRLAERLYEELRHRPTRKGTPLAVATHHLALRVTRTFWRWMVRKQIAEGNPWLDVEPVGRRKRGKPQLTRDEARRLVGQLLASDRPDATPVLCCLLLGLRRSEIVGITPRCLDDGGSVLLVPGTKTEAAKRPLEVPEMLRSRLATMAAEEWTSDRIYHAVTRWCERAGVPRVSPHGLRGTHASLAASAGATGALVAAQLGHTSEKVTAAHYTTPGAAASGKARTALRVLAGGG